MPPPRDEAWVVALLIGELHYMTRLNAITTRIVEHAVSLWQRQPASTLVCEAEPMAEVARQLGVPAAQVRVAIPEPAGHTTRWAALRTAALAGRDGRPVVLVTHRLHARRAARIFRAAGVTCVREDVDVPFDRTDPDWKLRSEPIFRIYNTVAWAYCFARGWL
jgi:uncharacterized SAM-binding protein YcdF (DUF218 family)